jgi:hypothetical protein
MAEVVAGIVRIAHRRTVGQASLVVPKPANAAISKAPHPKAAMPYYTKVLRPTEQVIFVGRLHWLIYSRGLLVFILGLLVLMVGIVSPVDIAGHLALQILSILVFAMATLILVVSAIQRIPPYEAAWYPAHDWGRIARG